MITVGRPTSVVVGWSLAFIIGARLFYVTFYGDGYYWAHPASRSFATNEGGMSFHGGLVAASWAASSYAACISSTHGLWQTLPSLAAAGLAWARCANFVNGEQWGKPTDLPWGCGLWRHRRRYAARHPPSSTRRFLRALCSFAFCRCSAAKAAATQGTFMGVFVMGYGIVRFLVEFVRVPDAQLGYLLGGVITMGQLLSLPLVIVGLALIIFARRRNQPQRVYLDA